jgi:Methyltransferase domain
MRLPERFGTLDEFMEALEECICSYSYICSMHASDVAVDADKFESQIPTEWQGTIENIDETKIGNQVVDYILDGTVALNWTESLIEYLHNMKSLSLPRDVKGTEFHPHTSEFPTNDMNDCRITAMNVKKRKEVTRLSTVVVDLAKSMDIDVVIDIGSGNGYLTNTLSSDFPVIAIEKSNDRITASEMKRRHFSDANFGTLYMNTFLTPENALSVLTSSELSCLNVQKPVPEWRYLLVGLHACGDLSFSTIPTLFDQCEAIKATVTVGCCYQRRRA